MLRLLVLASIVAATPARAEPARQPARDSDDHRRWVHTIVILGGGATYFGIELAFNSDLAASSCRWCNPPGLDASAYHHLLWNNPHAINSLSTVSGYFGNPAFAIGMLAVAAGPERTWRRLFDDVAPVLESAIATGLLQHTAKYTMGRQRPYVHFGGEPVNSSPDEANLSFFSGHVGLAFAVTTAATAVAVKRDSPLAPYILGGGLALATFTAYGRIAAGAHYLSDTVVGAVVGSGCGLAVPLLLHSDRWRHAEEAHGLTMIPAGPDGGAGLTLAGAF